MKKFYKKTIVTILTWLSRMVLLRYKPKIIAITGSVGKTSTKDAIFIVVSQFKKVRKSDKSFNSEIGLPLTILGKDNGWNNPFAWLEIILKSFWLLIWKHDYPEWLVLEVGVGKPGDMKKAASWIHPDIVVVTRFPDKPVHVEFFSSSEKIIQEKTILVKALKPSGTLIVNHDDEKVYALHQKSTSHTVSYGMHENATYHGVHASYMNFVDSKNTSRTQGINFKLEYNGNTFPVNLPHIVGMHYVGSALASVAVAHEIGCDLLLSIEAISKYKTPPGRLSLVEGINDTIIIDDTYNSSPVAVEAALDVLAEMKGNRKIAVLGDMLELGKFTEEAHKDIGKKVVGIADILVVVGPRAKFIAESALENGFKEKNIHRFNSFGSVGSFLSEKLKKGDIVLLKGSQGVRLEKVVKEIMAHPELAKDLLCRQEKEWQNR